MSLKLRVVVAVFFTGVAMYCGFGWATAVASEARILYAAMGALAVAWVAWLAVPRKAAARRPSRSRGIG
jgi:hypothetical protein